jgi:ABC-type polysaccharide/polyol phosphate export permease
MIAQAKTLFRYRLLIQSLVSRELKARYRGSVLGFLWSFINPLLLMFTYGLVFTQVFPMARPKAMDPYYLFLFCGILPWTWFQASLAEASGGLIAGGSLIKKVLFPAEVLPVVSVFANLMHFIFGLPVLLACLIFEGKLTAYALLLPIPVAIQLLFTLGLALFFSALTVHFRDLRDLLTHILHLWFWGSPILYFYGDMTGTLRTVLRLNPMAHIFVSYQEMLFMGEFHHYRGLALTGLLAVLTFALGAFVFERLRDTLPEEV